MSRRPLFTPTRAVIGLVLLAALVVGGLVWVSVSALRVEAGERTAAARADRAYRERLALWRLDSHMLAPLGLENNRPFNNYSALAPPAAVLVDDAGLPVPNPGRAASPLLSAELPDWMLLHFQLDAGVGWKSPQVLSPGLEANFQSEPLALPLTNCTPERADRLKALRARFPIDPTLARLAELDRGDPDAGLYVVPVPLADEPAADKPTPNADHPEFTGKEWAELAKAIECLDDRAAADPKKRDGKNTLAKGQKAGDQATDTDQAKKVPDGLPPIVDSPKKETTNAFSVQGANTAPPAPGPPASQQAQAGGQNFNLKQIVEQEMSPDAKARKGAADTVRTGGRGGYDLGNGARAVPQAGGYGQAGDVKGKLTNPEPQKKATPAESPTAPAPGAGIAPPVPTPTNPAQPQAPNDANALDRLKAEEFAKTLDESAKVARSRIQQQAEKGVREANDEAYKAKENVGRAKAAEGKGDDVFKGGKADTLPRLATGKSAGDAAADPAEAKAPPIVAPAVVRLGPVRPRWLPSADGEWQLLLVRTAAIGATGDRVVYQGVVVDWPTLQQSLTALVTDLFPAAALVPLRDGDDAPPEGTMSTLPVRLDTGPEPPCPDCGWTPLRFGLVLAWAAAVLAMIAVTLGGRAVLAMSERRVRFASAVTHELRTPLTALQLHLDLLNSGLITDEAKKAEYLATIAAEADRLNRLVENVLDFAKLEKQSAVAARPVPVSDLLAALRLTWEDRLRADGFELIAAATTPPGQTVTADPRVLEQVLGNLIDNARKYAKAATDRRIWVWVKPAGSGRLALEVEDRGPGVPTAERRGIFKPFTRGSGATDTGGAGLGLSLAKQWAELFGGAVSYRPADGGTGACFRLELPG